MSNWEIEVLVPTIGGCLLAALIVGLVIKRYSTNKKKPQFGTVTKAHRLTSFLNSVKIQPNLTEKRKPSLTLDYDSDLPENCGLSRNGSVLHGKHVTPAYDPAKDDQVWKVSFKLEKQSETDMVNLTIFRAKLCPLKFVDQKTYIFFQLQLQPDSDETTQTRTYLNTGSPSIDETVCFNVPKDKLAQSNIHISLYEIDSYRTRICHGHTLISLTSLTSLPIYLEKEMINNVLAKGIAEVLLTLKYTPQSGKLKMKLKSVRKLKKSEFDGYSYFNLITKVIVGSQIVKVKTTELPNWLDGIIDCGYHFRIPCKVIETCCIQFSIVGRGKVMESRKVMGSFTIGPSTYTSGSGMEHWRLMMANTNSVSEIWHEVVAPETK